MEVSKNDWKLFRTHIGEWQESYMEHLVKEYIALLSGTENASEKFWKLEEQMEKDRKHPGVMLELSKGNMTLTRESVSLILLILQRRWHRTFLLCFGDERMYMQSVVRMVVIFLSVITDGMPDFAQNNVVCSGKRKNAGG